MKELLPLPVSRIAFLNILYDKCKELLPLPVSKNAFVIFIVINIELLPLPFSKIHFLGKHL